MASSTKTRSPKRKPNAANRGSSEHIFVARIASSFDRFGRSLTLITGFAIVSLWTVIRHWTNGVNFDVVGQIGLAQQWAQGHMSGAQLGATNYVIKMPLYYVVNQLDFLSPMNRILVLALALNIITFALLFIVIEKILRLYNVERRGMFYTAMLWLATIAGNVFWIDYANSRNIEVVGGVILAYLALRFIYRPNWWLLPIVVAGSSVLFFADSLQLYVCGVGTAIFMIGRLVVLRSRSAILQSIGFIGALGLGFAGAKGLAYVCKKFLHICFLQAPSAPHDLTISNAWLAAKGVTTNTLYAFGADFTKQPITINSIREALNALVLVALLGLTIRFIAKNRRMSVMWLTLSIIVVNYLIYIASGQALQPQTARYLIMVPIFFILIVAMAGSQLTTTYRNRLLLGWTAINAACLVILCGALVVSWPVRHQKDQHIGAVASFMKQQHFEFALTSRQIGVTGTYFSEGKTTLLPFGCNAQHEIHPTNLFYDNDAFAGLYAYTGDVPIILGGGSINFGTYNCDRDDILMQFGQPKREVAIPGVGPALIYDAASLRIGDIQKIVGHQRIDTSTASIAQLAAAATLPNLGNCELGTLTVVVAHTDDDLLFMNPGLMQKVRQGMCVRSIYITAADGGRGPSYWRDRERGIQAAYNHMLGTSAGWNTFNASIDGHTVTTRSPIGRPSVSLTFLRLPDGGVKGEGFASTHYISLQKMAANHRKSAATVDGSGYYNYRTLTHLMRVILHKDRPNLIFTSVPNGEMSVGDHSDHTIVGRLTLLAASMVKSQAIISMYVGYPDNGLPPNISLADSIEKQAIFDSYAANDDVICPANQPCHASPTYSKYFTRSYKLDQIPPMLRQTTEPAPAPLPKPIPHSKGEVLDLFKKP